MVCSRLGWPWAILGLASLLALPTSLAVTATDCAPFFDLEYRAFDVDRYGVFYDESPVFTLPQTGEYRGVPEILEYVLFASPTNPIFSTVNYPDVPSNTYLRGVDNETGVCQFIMMEAAGYVANGQFAIPSAHPWVMASMFLIEYLPSTGKIKNVYMNIDVPTIETWFGMFDTAAMQAFVCQTMRSSCSDVWEFNGLTTMEECMAGMAELPLFSDGPHARLDGMSRGCRYLHAVFANVNPAHCAHISFAPMADADGRFKCQQSKNLSLDHNGKFGEGDFLNFGAWQRANMVPPAAARLTPERALRRDTCGNARKSYRENECCGNPARLIRANVTPYLFEDA